MSSFTKRLTSEQARGVSPSVHAWMSASAGTGKTEVLTARILRLLLAGAPPESILAITYTKAGAAEMTARIRKRLASWVQMKRSDLARELFAIHVDAKHADQTVRQAQTLFARVIDAPGGGLAIQTIHSFCQSLLAAFPEEANLAPGFRAIDEVEAGLLHHETLNDLLANATDRGDHGFLGRVAQLSVGFAEDKMRQYLAACAAAHDQITRLPSGLRGWLRHQFDLPLTDTPDDWLVEQCTVTDERRHWLNALRTSLLRWNPNTGRKRADIIADWLDMPKEQRAAEIAGVIACVLTQKGALLAIYQNDNQCSDVAEEAGRIGEWLSFASQRHTQMISSDLVADGLDVGRRYAQAYVERKQREGLVDYNDLIDRALSLVRDDSDTQWIRYKLDRRIDHVLVDEAQDTNSQQWAIVKALTEEFFAGEGASDGTGRTLFAVGDAKQAIYGFQGTSPDYFQAAQTRFSALAHDSEQQFEELEITTSFRSSAPVLDIVDTLIANVSPVSMGMFSDDEIRHRPFVDDAPGRVVMWPLEKSTAGGNEEGGAADDDDDDSVGDGSDGGGDSDDDAERWLDKPARRVATKIARTVRNWIDHGIDGEPVVPSDVMILVRKRAELARLIVARLQSVNVPVAGVDRLKLRLPIGVQDLMSAARFVLQPLDSLNLASLLASPLIGWSHEEISRRAWRMDSEGRESMPLWPHLSRQTDLREAIAPLLSLLNMAGYRSPYQFFEELLSGPLQGRARLLARLGPEARDPIEELLNQALAFETRDGQSMHRFVQWFDSGNLEIKRELEDDGGDVRVMTVHGAKGLQSKIVILADAAHDPAAKRRELLNWPIKDGTFVPLMLISKAGNARTEALSQAIDKAEAQEAKESLRLLYVAMTRAERMLFVVGSLPKHDKVAENNWYDLIQRAVEEQGVQWCDDDAVWNRHLSYIGTGKPEKAKAASIAEAVMALPPPAWLRKSPAPEQRPPRPLSPSADEERASLLVANPPSAPYDRDARMRGIMMHSLFERLPAVPVATRQAAADRWLSAQMQQLSRDERTAMFSPVLAIMSDPRFARLFSSGSLAEVPFSALVGGRVIAGTIDRLVADDDEVHIVDFKTGHHVPDTETEIPTAYLRQMAAYAASMEVVFPGKRVRASLLYTGGPKMITLTDAILIEHQPTLVQT